MFQLERQTGRVLRSQHKLQPNHTLSRPQHSNVCTYADVTAGVQTCALCHDAKKILLVNGACLHASQINCKTSSAHLVSIARGCVTRTTGWKSLETRERLWTSTVRSAWLSVLKNSMLVSSSICPNSATILQLTENGDYPCVSQLTLVIHAQF